ncbi:MAG: arylsulfatase, partial [Pseudomonadota bacterium]
GCAEDMPDAIDTAAVPRPPNILLIVVDDMGYTDLGAFGSEIPTPNLDELAYGGLRLTNFHASGQCAPTRAMLMSGADNHKAGMGSMFGDNFIQGGHGGRWGYERYLHPRVASLPERLKDAGYRTYMAGKWHLGGDDSKKPSARGFDRTFALMDGSASHFRIQSVARPAVYREDGVRLDELPNGFYSTNTYTDKLIGFIDDGRDSDKPFFAYLALTAPHWPLQVPDEYLERFRGDYDEGYDALRARRLLQAENIGAVPAVDSELLAPTGKRWDELDEDERRYSARTMELYAAMVQNADDNVGRLMTYLRDTAQFDNTFVFFMSDNGAEADRDDKNPTFVRGINRNGLDNGYETLGTEASWPFVREGWAQATAAPFRLYKGFLTEGGTRVAAFAVHPAMRADAEVRGQYLTVMDVMPTLLEIAGAEYDPNAYAGREVLPMDGASFMTLFDDPVATIHHSDEVIASELHGQRALVRGNYKIVWEQMTANVWWADEEPDHWRRWRLYNLAEDPTEQHDLADAEPERLAELAALWDEWAAANDVMTEVTPYWPE